MPHIDAFPPPNKQAPSNTSEQPGMKSGKYPLILIVAITINSPFTRAKILMFTEYRESEEWAELSRHHFARLLDPRHKMRVSLPKSGENTVMATAAIVKTFISIQWWKTFCWRRYFIEPEESIQLRTMDSRQSTVSTLDSRQSTVSTLGKYTHVFRSDYSSNVWFIAHISTPLYLISSSVHHQTFNTTTLQRRSVDSILQKPKVQQAIPTVRSLSSFRGKRRNQSSDHVTQVRAQRNASSRKPEWAKTTCTWTCIILVLLFLSFASFGTPNVHRI